MSGDIRPHYPVVIVGGGLTGLCSALYLARSGIDFLLAERHTGTSRHPKARALNPRATEALRAAGVGDDLTANISPIAENTDLIHVHSLAGAERVRLPRPSVDDISSITGANWTFIDQNALEPILLRAIPADGGQIRFGTECIAISQDEEKVDLILRNQETGDQQTVSADYVIAADGSRSRLRAMLGIGDEGPGLLSSMVSFLFEADLSTQLRGRKIIAAYVLNDNVKGTLMPLDNATRWVFNVSYYPEHGEDLSAFDQQWCLRKTRAGIGDNSVEVQIETEKLQPWEISGRVSQRMTAGRVFIAGDAAHVMPPTGAFGASTGIQDAHNLCWKLARVIRGDDVPNLLDSYESERLPVANLVVDQSMLRFRVRQGGTLESVQERMFDEIEVSFGPKYLDGGDGRKPGYTVVNPRTRPADVGCRAPHVVLSCEGALTPLHDLIDYRFYTLLVNGTFPGLEGLSEDGVIVRCVDGAGGLTDDGEFGRIYGLERGGAVLVRPDGYICWRFDRPIAVDNLVNMVQQIVRGTAPAGAAS